MEDLISRQAAIDALLNHYEVGNTTQNATMDDCVMLVRKLPSAQKTGRWQITDAYPHNVYCSECNAKFAQTHWAVWEDGSLPRNYCPNCGAKMEDNDGTED